MTKPAYAWAKNYSHTDRRHWLKMVSDLAERHEHLEKPDGDVFLVLIRKLPLDGNDPVYDRDPDLENRPFLGATWSKTTPDKLRISTRRCARARDVETYAEMDAKEKRYTPLVIEMVE